MIGPITEKELQFRLWNHKTEGWQVSEPYDQNS